MNLKHLFLVTITLFKMITARYAGTIPKFYGLDSAIIVDTDKSLPSPSRTKFHSLNRQPQYFHRLHYPFYQIIPRSQQTRQSTEAPLTTTTTTTTTPTPNIYTNEEYPADLLDIAQNKLGIKNLDEIPSISELGDLLGTQSAEETIKYIRELTATEDGVALVKAYIESSDYTDSTGGGNSQSSSATANNSEDPSSNFDVTEPGFFERMSNYLNFFEFFVPPTVTKPSGKQKEEEQANSLQQLDRITSHGKKQQQQPATAAGNMLSFKPHTPSKPLLVRNPLPYHYPIPIRPLVLYHPKDGAAHAQRHPLQTNMQGVVHLNTPKLLMPTVPLPREATQPTVRKTAAATTTTKQQHKQQQQQLDDLAARVSKFPLTHSRDALIDAQYLAAIEKAFAEDEDLKKILGSTETLK